MKKPFDGRTPPARLVTEKAIGRPRPATEVAALIIACHRTPGGCAMRPPLEAAAAAARPTIGAT